MTPMAPVMTLLASGMAITSLAGPLVLGVMEYRTSPTTLNQLLGSDAATLFVIAPLALVTALLARRGHPAAPLLASGIGAFAVYTYANSAPDASVVLTLGFAGFALLFLGLTVALYRPLFQLSAVEAGTVGSR